MYYHDQAIVLARKDFRDDDLLVTFFTLGQGKIIAQAKGAKKIKSKLRGHLEPMNLVEIDWVAGRNGEKLIGASVIKSYREIKENYKETLFGFYFLEIIDKTTKTHHAEAKIFEFIKNVLEKLEKANEEELPLIKLCFDYKILFLLGYNPTNRKGISLKLKNIIKQIIDFPVEKLAVLNLAQDINKELSFKALLFFEEVAEEKIKSREMIE